MYLNKVRKAAIVACWILVWQCVAVVIDNSIMLATPIDALKALWALLPRLEFWQTIGMSLIRIGIGFLIGCVVAFVCASFSKRFLLVEEFLSPLISLLKNIPVASFVVILLIWWGSSFLAVAISFLVVMPNVYVNTLEGLKNTDIKMLEMATVFKLPWWNRFFYIYRPALQPYINSALKISLGMSWKSGVAAEVIGTPDFSIGEALYMSKIYLDTAGVLAWTLVIVVLSFCFEKIIMQFVHRFFAWQPRCRKAQRGQSETKEIQLSQVVKRYGEQTILANVNQIYEKEQIYTLNTPSGSGKTTLLRLIAGLEIPDAGSIACSGNCSMMFQEDRLCEAYSAVRNVEVVIGKEEDAKAALLELLEEEALEKPCSQLSGGMKRRVALVRAMEADSDYVLLDEPFTGMDVDTRQKAWDYIEKRKGERVLIIATHI